MASRHSHMSFSAAPFWKQNLGLSSTNGHEWEFFFPKSRPVNGSTALFRGHVTRAGTLPIPKFQVTADGSGSMHAAMYRDLWTKIHAKDRQLSLSPLAIFFSISLSLSLPISQFLHVSAFISLPVFLYSSPSSISLNHCASFSASLSLWIYIYLPFPLPLWLCLSVCKCLSLSFLCLFTWSVHLRPSGSMSVWLSVYLLPLKCLSVYLSVWVCLSVYMSDYLCLSLSLPLWLFFSIPVYLPDSLSLRLSVSLRISVCLSTGLFISLKRSLCLSIFLSLSLSLLLSLSLNVCLSICYHNWECVLYPPKWRVEWTQWDPLDSLSKLICDRVTKI